MSNLPHPKNRDKKKLLVSGHFLGLLGSQGLWEEIAQLVPGLERPRCPLPALVPMAAEHAGQPGLLGSAGMDELAPGKVLG